MLERPTIHSLGFEWRLEGDANGNAEAAVRYRPTDATAWRDGIPPFRTGLGVTIDNSMIGRGARYVVPDALIGSVLDLDAGTEYEVELTLKDPDGVVGPAVKTFVQRTRQEPVVPTKLVEVRHVYPPDYQGETGAGSRSPRASVAAPPDPRRIISHNAYNRAAQGAPCKVGKESYPSLDAMRAQTGYDRDSFFADGYSVFANAVEPPHAARNTPLVTPESVHLSPKPDSDVIDAGTLIPGINDDFAGKAPDIGALEFGKAPPTFGPRSREGSAGRAGQDAAIE